jgi:hypothetical protein
MDVGSDSPPPQLTPEPAKPLAAVRKNSKVMATAAIKAAEQSIIDDLQRELQFECEWPMASPPSSPVKN